MKTVKFLISFFITLMASSAFGQDEKKPGVLYIDTGMDFLSALSPAKDYIRADIDQYYYGYAATTLKGHLYKNYLGVKYETRFLKKKLGILSGLRYTRMVSSLGKENYWSGSSDYFYMLFSQEDTRTDYMKVKEINQVAGYIGIPLELRIYPYIKERKSNIYVYYKIGSDFNFRIHSRTTAVFSNSAMNQYKDEPGKIVEKPWSFYSSFHLGVGFRIGKPEKPGVNIELLYPASVWGEDKPALVSPDAGGGVQVNVRLPF